MHFSKNFLTYLSTVAVSYRNFSNFTTKLLYEKCCRVVVQLHPTNTQNLWIKLCNNFNENFVTSNAKKSAEFCECVTSENVFNKMCHTISQWTKMSQATHAIFSSQTVKRYFKHTKPTFYYTQQNCEFAHLKYMWSIVVCFSCIFSAFFFVATLVLLLLNFFLLCISI